MTDLALVSEGFLRESCLRLCMEVAFGGVVPSGIEVDDGTSTWRTLAPATGHTEQQDARVTMRIRVLPGGQIPSGALFENPPFSGDLWRTCSRVDNDSDAVADIEVEAVAQQVVLVPLPPFTGGASPWIPQATYPDLVFVFNDEGSTTSEPSRVVKVPCEPVTEPLQFSEAGAVTNIATTHPDLISVVNEFASIQGTADTRGELDLRGGISILERPESIAQQIWIRLNFFLGEWFLDERQGIPYIERILVKNPSSAAVKAIIRRTILTVPGIVEVDDVTFDLGVARTARVRFKARLSGSDDPLVYDREFVIGEVLNER